MLTYIIGLALLSAGFFSFMKQLTPLDNTPALNFIKTSSTILTLTFFGIGFFYFPWYAPFLGLWVVSALIALVIFPLLSMLILKEQLAMILGSVLCAYALLNV